jgi:excisionase family DNA binding protein
MIGQLLTIKEACQVLKVSRATMSAMIRDGRVRAKNLNPGGLQPRWRVFADSLTEESPIQEKALVTVQPMT